MNESYLIAAAVLLLIVILGITGEAIWKWMTRERGPWVVTRVGIGGREFRALVGPMEWVTTVRMAYHWSSHTVAEMEAKRRLADVAPLSQYTGVK